MFGFTVFILSTGIWSAVSVGGDRSPCPSGVLLVKQAQNTPPGKRNSYVGVVSLQHWPNLPEVELTVYLANAQKFDLKDDNGRVSTVPGGYKISYNQPSSTLPTVEFSVRGKPNGRFPEPTGLSLNGQDICNNIDSISEITTKKPNVIPPDLENRFTPDSHQSSCGRKQIHHQGLVTSGFPTEEGEWPWHSALYLRKDTDHIKYICGGSLISTQAVVTAGHCLIEGGHSITPDRLIVKLGLHNKAIASSNTHEYPVFDIHIHDEFNHTSLKHDIAILKLSQRVHFSAYIQQVCLWPQDSIALDSVVGRPGIIVGWGLDETDTLSDILKQGSMPVVSLTTCLESNPGFFGSLLSDYNFCAGYRNGTSVCNGDSGGGMVFEQGGAYYLRGIVSLAVAQENKAVCNPRHFAVFTDVAKHLNWIRTHM